MVKEIKKRVQIDENTPEVYIAVYGTLRKGEGNHHLLKDSELIGTFESEPIYSMYTGGGFPVLSENGKTSIIYEVYKVVDYLIMERLHNLEGCNGYIDDQKNSWYTLKEIKTPLEHTCYIYIQNDIEKDDRLKLIVNGDWINRKF